MIEDKCYLQSRAIETLQLGLELGMMHIDTAEMYEDGPYRGISGKSHFRTA
jgi:aryl-alcohol dehydrogenase-like predicted oxidoreductase